MAMTWTPEREGNWLFHCHIMQHVSPERRLAPTGDHTADHQHMHEDGAGGMAGMIIGVTIVRGGGQPPAASAPVAACAQDQARDGARPVGAGACLRLHRVGERRMRTPTSDGPARLSTPGPTLVLQRDEPVEITVVNHLGEATALHWHGMELESYYDGVHGWSGNSASLAPMIEAGRVLRRPLHAAANGHVHVPHAPARPASAPVRALRSDGGRRSGRDLRSPDGPRADGRAAWTRSCCAERDPVLDTGRPERRHRAPVRVEGRAASPSAADQHHARRHLRGVDPDDARTRDVDAADEGRRAAACRACARRRPRVRRSPSAKPTTSSSTRCRPVVRSGSRSAARVDDGRRRGRSSSGELSAGR